MRKLNFILLAVLLGLAGGLAPLPAAADDSDERGKELAVEGFKAYQKGSFEEALKLFEEARTHYPTGQVLRMYGYTLLGLKRWVQAADALEEALSTKLKPLPEADRPEVQENLNKALSHLGTVTIETNVPGATVIIDTSEEEALPVESRRLLEGTHSLVGKAEGRKDLVVEVAVTAEESQTVRLDFPVIKPEPEPEPNVPEDDSTMRILGLSLGAAGLLTAGIGAATLGSGVSLEGWTEDRISSYNALYRTGCSADQYASCSYEAAAINQQADRAEALQGAGVGLLIGGVALVATGVTLFLLAPSGSAGSAEPDSSDSATLSCGPYGLPGLGCQGTF